MPNGGITPDCVHCKSYRGQPFTEEAPFCELHQMKLPYPIRAFCSGYVDSESMKGFDWLDLVQAFDLEELRDDFMYLWLGGFEIKFFHVPLTPIEDYKHWTREKFLEEVATLSDKYRKEQE